MEGSLDELRRLAGVSESDDEQTSTQSWLPAASPTKKLTKNEDEADESSSEEGTVRKKAVKLEEDDESEMSGDDAGEEESGSEEESEDGESEEEDSMDEEDLESGDDDDEEEEDATEDGDADASELLSESDGESEKCPICLGRFQGQDIGTPESCDHTFCLECIEEWSKNVNTCPVDRQIFHLIFARHDNDEKIFKQIKVKDRQLAEDEAEDDPTDCEICGRSDREDRLLLCDGCDLGYHCECLDPPIDTIPVDEWFCPDCTQDRAAQAQATGSALAEEVDDSEEIMFLIQENEGATGRPSLRPQRRQVARTRQSERVRAAIQQLRETRARVRQIITSPTPSDDEDSNVAAAEPGPSRSSAVAKPRRKTTRKTRRKTSTRRRKTTKKKTKSASSTKKVGKRKTKRRVSRKGKKRKGKRLVKVKQLTPVTAKSRLASRLGLSKPPVGRSIPLVKTPTERNMDLIRSDTGIASLSILGERDSLNFFESDEENMVVESAEAGVTSASTAQVARSRAAHKYSRSALKSHTAINFHAAARRKKVLVSEPEPCGSGVCDLLGQIMQDQTLLQMEGRNVTINRDGSLRANQTNSGSKKGKRSSDAAVTDATVDDRDKSDGMEAGNDEGQDADGVDDANDEDAGEAGSEAGSGSDGGGEAGDSAGETGGEQGGEQSGEQTGDGGSGGEGGDGDSQQASDHDSENEREEVNTKKDDDDNMSDDEEEQNAGDAEEAAEPKPASDSENRPSGDDSEAESDADTKVKNSDQDADQSKKNKDKADKSGEIYDPCSPSADVDSASQEDEEEENKAEVSEATEGLSDHKSPEFENEEDGNDDEGGELKEPEVDDDVLKVGFDDSDDDLDKPSGIQLDDDDDDVKDEEEEDTPEEESDPTSSSRVPISELPRIPKLKRKIVVEEEEEEEEESYLDLRKHGSVLSRLDARVKEQTYPKWEKKNKRDRKSRDYDSDRSPADHHKKEEYNERYESKHREKGRSRDHERERADRSDKNREKDDEYRSSRKKRKRSKSRSRERTKERHRRSRSRSQERSRRRAGERSRSRERQSERSRRSRNERSRSRERSERSHRKDRSPDKKYSDSYSKSPRSNRHEEKSRHRYDRERSSEDSYKEYKDSKEDRKRSSDSDYKGSVKLFSQSLGGVTKERNKEDTNNRIGKLKRNVYQTQNENAKRRKSMDEDDDDDCEIIAVEMKPRSVVGAVFKPPEPPEQVVESSNYKFVKPGDKHISFKIEVDKNRPRESSSDVFEKLDQSHNFTPVESDNVVSSSDSVSTSQIKKSEEKDKTDDTAVSSEADDGAKDNNDTDMDLDEGSYDPSEPTDSASPPMQQIPISLPPMMPFRIGESSAMTMPPPRALMQPDEFSEQSILEGNRPPLPPGMVPSNLVMHPPPHRLSMMPPHGVPPNMQVMTPNMVVNSLLLNRPPPFGRIPRMPPSRLGWQMNHPPPNVFMPPQQNQFGQPVSQPGLVPHSNGIDVMSIDPRTRPPFPHMMHPQHPQQQHSHVVAPPRSEPMTSAQVRQPPPVSTMSQMKEPQQPEPSNQILPLAPKAVDQLKEISKLLSTQAKLAELGKQKKSTDNVFKMPVIPSSSSSVSTTTGSAGSKTGPAGRGGKAADTGTENDAMDIEALSPTDDDEFAMSFSPPPESKPESKRSKTDKKHQQRHHRSHKRDKDKMADSSNQDDVPSSAVELDKQTKLMKKLNHRERVVEEVKLAIKPYYAKGKIDKDDYKEIMRKAVPKVCHSKSGDINPVKIKSLVEAYVTKVRGLKKYQAKNNAK